MRSASFDIKLCGDVLWVTLCGPWDLMKDMAYLTALAEKMKTMRKGSWAMVVDMRHWDNESYTQSPPEERIAKLDLDRRNQKAEAWIVRENKQAEVLVPFIEHQSGLRFMRSCDENEVKAWLQSLGFDWRSNCC